MKKITIKDIADYCGVSITTVSFIMNGKTQNISQETILAVNKAIKVLGYTRNEIARSLVTSKTYTIALVVPDITNLFYAAIAKEVNQVAIDNDYNVLLCDTSNSLTLEKKQIKILDSKRIDGLIVASRDSEKLLKSFENSRKVPIVIIDEDIENDSDYTLSVFTDDIKAGYLATRYMIERGHSNFFVLEGLEDSTNSRKRHMGVEKAVSEFDIDTKNIKYFNCDYKYEDAYITTLENYDKDKTAIIAFNDLMAYGAINALKKRMFNVPYDVSIICIDAINNKLQYSEILPLRLTSLSQEAGAIGKIAGIALINKINNRNNDSIKRFCIERKLYEGDTVRNI